MDKDQPISAQTIIIRANGMIELAQTWFRGDIVGYAQPSVPSCTYCGAKYTGMESIGYLWRPIFECKKQTCRAPTNPYSFLFDVSCGCGM
jgi:hypothetical protein